MSEPSKVRGALERFHRSQSGAIALLCLAGLLIIFMTAMMMFDAGQAARDKMDVQIGADTAALSHAAVRARGMNMLAYSNITKRILYGYTTIYVAAFMALIETTAYYFFIAAENAGEAVAWCSTIIGCVKGVFDAVQAIDNAITSIKGVIQLVLEIIEFGTVTGGRLFGIPGMGDFGRSIREVTALDYYQDYTAKMNPWWAWGEAVTRGMRNGSTLVGTWPIPDGDLARLRNKIRFGLNALNSVFSVVPAPDDLIKTTPKTDSLPVEQLPKLLKLGPWFSAIGAPKWMAHAKLCGKMLFSPDFWLMQYYYDHHRPSEGYWDDTRAPSGSGIAPRTLITLLEITQLPVGCVLASLTLGHESLPYDIKAGVQDTPLAGLGSKTKDAWLGATSNVSFGYRKGKGRFDDSKRRSKMTFMSKEYELTTGDVFFRNDGYWAVSKAEIMYETGLIGKLGNGAAGMSGSLPAPFSSVVSGALNFFNSWFNEPSMWAPRWTARARPLALPDEDALYDMDAMFHDALPFMALTTPLALAYGEGGAFPSVSEMTNIQNQAAGAMSFLENFGRDVIFMETAANGFVVGKQQSGWEK